jgi:hypothetical protein
VANSLGTAAAGLQAQIRLMGSLKAVHGQGLGEFGHVFIQG